MIECLIVIIIIICVIIILSICIHKTNRKVGGMETTLLNNMLNNKIDAISAYIISYYDTYKVIPYAYDYRIDYSNLLTHKENINNKFLKNFYSSKSFKFINEYFTKDFGSITNDEYKVFSYILIIASILEVCDLYPKMKILSIIGSGGENTVFVINIDNKQYIFRLFRKISKDIVEKKYSLKLNIFYKSIASAIRKLDLENLSNSDLNQYSTLNCIPTILTSSLDYHRKNISNENMSIYNPYITPIWAICEICENHTDIDPKKYCSDCIDALKELLSKSLYYFDWKYANIMYSPSKEKYVITDFDFEDQNYIIVLRTYVIVSEFNKYLEHNYTPENLEKIMVFSLIVFIHDVFKCRRLQYKVTNLSKFDLTSFDEKYDLEYLDAYYKKLANE